MNRVNTLLANSEFSLFLVCSLLLQCAPGLNDQHRPQKSVCNSKVLNAAILTVKPVNSNSKIPYLEQVSGNFFEWYASKTCFPSWIWNRAALHPILEVSEYSWNSPFVSGMPNTGALVTNSLISSMQIGIAHSNWMVLLSLLAHKLVLVWVVDLSNRNPRNSPFHRNFYSLWGLLVVLNWQLPWYGPWLL